jgi:PAS domain S-box-containing protein
VSLRLPLDRRLWLEALRAPMVLATLVLGLALALAWNLLATPGPGGHELAMVVAPAGVVLLGSILALFVLALGRASRDARRRADAAEHARKTLGLEVLERLRAEQQARESESRWRAVWEASPLGIFIADADGRCRFTNAEYQRLSGLTADEALGDGWARAIHPDDRDRFVAEWQACAKARQRFHASSRYRHADGSVRHVDVRAVEYSDGVDRIGYVGFLEDVTEQHHVNVLRDARTRELETLLTVSSHDLQEPLLAMGGIASLLRQDHADRLDPAGRDLIERLVRGTRRMSELVSAVGAVVRAQALAPGDEAVDGERAVRTALGALARPIASTGAAVSLVQPFPVFPGSEPWVAEALTQIVGNALKFTRPGAAPEIEIAAWPRDADHPGEVGFVVHDRGSGVAPLQRELIFRLFRRGVGRDVEGLGAGLAVVRAIAERHGGRVFVQPRDGGGSSFVVTFAATARPAA